MQILTLLRLLPGLACLALLAAFLRANDKAHDWKVQANHCAEARKADRKSYEDAQKQAADKNMAEVRDIEQRQKAKTDAIQSRWDADRARLAGLLRNSGNPAPQGSAGHADSPQVPDTAPRADGSGQVCIPEGDALSAAENELKLFYLQEWVRGQLRVAH